MIRRLLVAAWSAVGIGVAVLVVATVAFGDWYLIRQPWAGLGLGLIVWGLGAAAVISVVVVSWPVRWATVAAIPGLLITLALWTFALTMPLSGACCDQPPFPRDPSTILYSLPILIPILAASTAAIAIPLLKERGSTSSAA